MSDRGHDLAASAYGKICKECRGDLAAHIREGIPVEEKERGAAMTPPQEIYGFFERDRLRSLRLPLARARCLSLSIKAVLRASSCARSSIEADDKLPVPVFDKSGSGLQR